MIRLDSILGRFVPYANRSARDKVLAPFKFCQLRLGDLSASRKALYDECLRPLRHRKLGGKASLHPLRKISEIACRYADAISRPQRRDCGAEHGTPSSSGAGAVHAHVGPDPADDATFG